MDQATVAQLNAIFAPAAVAVVGASDSYEKWGFQVLSAIEESYGAAGRPVYAVNPGAASVHMKPSYPSLAAIPGPVDLAAITVPAPQTMQVIRDCIAKGVKGAVIITGGFAEAGAYGASLQQDIMAVARCGGLRIVGPNIMGHLDTGSGLTTTPYVPHVITGQVALASQSGNVGVQILQYGFNGGLGFSKFVGTGNEADLSLEDFLEYFALDPATRIICLYIEGLKDARRFMRLAAETSRFKPIVAIKAGASPAGAAAARSHTSALAGSEEAYEAAFRQSGVIRVRSVQEMIFTASALSVQPLPKGRRIGVVTIGGGIGVLAADECRRLGLETATISEATVAAIDRYLPPFWSRRNPVDVVGDSLATSRCILALLEDPGVDAILSISTPGLRRVLPKRIAHIPPEFRQETLDRINAGMDAALLDFDAICKRSAELSKPVVFCKANPVEEEFNPRFFALARERGHVVYPTLDHACASLANLARYADYLS